MIDTHAHIDGPEFADDLEEVIQRAKDAGVEKIFVPGICLKDTPHLLEVCQAHPNYLYPMIGLHPENIMDEDYHHVLDSLESMLVSETLQSAHSPNPIIAIGEIGLDLYWDDTHKQEQIEVFEHQIQWAEKYDLPLMIHSRNAHKELMEVMERHRASNLSGVFHCFTGTEEEARNLLTFPNFMLGIGGVLTFKKSKLPETLAAAVPLSRIVLETDAPYMAPVPMRGQRNEPAFVAHVCRRLAEVYGVSEAEVSSQTNANCEKILNIRV